MIPLWVTLFRVAMGRLRGNRAAGLCQRLGEVRSAAATLKAGRLENHHGIALSFCDK